MYDRRTLVNFPKDMELTEFDSIRKAAKAIGVGEGVIRYANNNGKDFLNPSGTKGGGVKKDPFSRCFLCSIC